MRPTPMEGRRDPERAGQLTQRWVEARTDGRAKTRTDELFSASTDRRTALDAVGGRGGEGGVNESLQVNTKMRETQLKTQLKRNLKQKRHLQNSILRRTCLFSFAVIASLLSPKPSNGQGIKISGTMLTDENQARVTATGNSCRQGFPCGKYGQHYYWCWTSYSGDWDYCCAPEQTCGRHGMGYDWCWADTEKNTWSYCKKSKLSKPKSDPVVVTSKPTTTTTRPTTTTTTTTTIRKTTTNTPYTRTRAKTYIQNAPSSSSYKSDGGNQLQKQILSNVESAVQRAVASSQQDIRKIDKKMERLEDNLLNQERRIQKLDRMEQMQRDTNQTLTQITKWIRYLSSSVDGLTGMKKKVDILTKESEQQRGGFNTMYKNALKSNEIDNNSISSPFYNYQRKGPSESPVARPSTNSSARPMVVQNLSQSIIILLAGFLLFAFFENIAPSLSIDAAL